MSKFEKRLCVLALVFVAIYLGAVVVTLHSRMDGKTQSAQRIESEQVRPAEGRLLLVELFLPMAILLTLTVSYIVVRKTRAKKALLLDEPDETPHPE
jgi:NADH:ubiquinone oxidoreductase subunit 6 (subunit J)